MASAGTVEAAAPSPRPQQTMSTPERQRRGRIFTRYDFLGLGLAASIIFHWPGGDEQMYSVLFVMVPAFILLGLSILKARPLFRRARWAAVPVAAALFLLVWGVISSAASGAPQVVTIFGEWGRADGLLTLIACIALCLAVATAPLPEVSRMIAWVILAGGVALVIGYLNFYAGIEIVSTAAPGTFAATFGNQNFSAGFFATTGALALFMTFTTRNWVARIALLAYAAGTAISMGPNGSLQGPLAYAAGIGAAAVALLLTVRGRWRAVSAAVAALAVLGAAILTTLTLAERGPLGAAFYADYGIIVRRHFWDAALKIAEAYPLFGIGPDGFSRYVAQYRSDDYVSLLGLLAENAVHSVPLHTLVGYGIPGLIAWIVVMVGSLAGLLLFLARIQPSSARRMRWIGAAVAAGLAGYIAQAAVSIDFYSLKATGWFMAGAAIAVVLRSLETDEQIAAGTVPPTPPGKPLTNERILAAWGLGVLVAIVGAGSVIWWASMIPKVGSISPTEARSLVVSPWVHCNARVQWLNELQKAEADEVPSALELMAVDPRCYPFTSGAAGALVNANSPEANETVNFYAMVDPKSFVSQAYLAQHRLIIGDIPGAKAAQAEMNRLAGISQDVDQGFVDKVNEILAAGYKSARQAGDGNGTANAQQQ